MMMLALLFLAGSLNAVYIQVFTTTTNGSIACTGNTLGLNKASNQNLPGNLGSIGAFISTDNSQTVPGWIVNGVLLNGLTLDWQKNGSTAFLDIPQNSEILHAELIWAGSYGFDPSVTQSTTSQPVTFVTPVTTYSITPKDLYSKGGTGQFRTQSSSTGFYVRSADVTDQLIALGPNVNGAYSVGHVPATVAKNENNLNCAGWTLLVAYSNPLMLTSNLYIYVACEASGAAPSEITGFQAPSGSGSISSRVFVSALEGDPQLACDQFLIGPTKSLDCIANSISGDNNPQYNFFASQINTILTLGIDSTTGKLIPMGNGTLDQRGSFGYLNSTPCVVTNSDCNCKNSSGANPNACSKIPAANFSARQGYDITSIDIGQRITPGQTTLYAQGVTNQDVYTIDALAIQIQVTAPIIESSKSANVTSISAVGNQITYTCEFKNTGTADASLQYFSDTLPPGLTYVPDTFTVNSTPETPTVTGSTIQYNLASGGYGTLPVGQTITIEFTVETTSPLYENYDNFGTLQYTYTNGPVLTSNTNVVKVTGPGPVQPPVLVANPDEGSVGNGKVGGVAIDNVLINDTVDGIPANLATVCLYQTSSASPSPSPGNVSLDTSTGQVIVSPGTPEGVYTFNYKICQLSDGNVCSADEVNCSSTTVTVYVGPPDPEIVANIDSGTTVTSPDTTLGVANVLANDTVNGDPATLDNVNLTYIPEGSSPYLTLDTSTGAVYVKPNTPPGLYTLNYMICDVNNSENCSNTIVYILVTNPIDPYPPIVFQGYLKKCAFLNRTEYRINTFWTPSGAQDVVAYKIYLGSKVVATIPASDPLAYNFCLKDKEEASDFSIVAVTQKGVESRPRTKIKVIYEKKCI